MGQYKIYRTRKGFEISEIFKNFFFKKYTIGPFCRQSQTFERNDWKSKDKKGNVY